MRASIAALISAEEDVAQDEFGQAFDPDFDEHDAQVMHSETNKLLWPPWRRKLHRVLNMPLFDVIMGVIASISTAVIIMESDSQVKCELEGCTPDTFPEIHFIILVFYIVELAMRLIAERMRFFESGWHWLDLLIVLTGIIDAVLMIFSGAAGSSINVLVRMSRAARVLRIAHMFQSFPELNKMIIAFVAVLRIIVLGFILIMCLVGGWALIALQVVEPYNRTVDHDYAWCDNIFSSFGMATLFFFQTLVAGDDWGKCGLPIILEHPAMFLLFAASLFTVQLGFTNLVLAVIVDKAAESREHMAAKEYANSKVRQKHSVSMLNRLLDRIDTNRNGHISLQELMDGFDADEEFKARFHSLGLGQEEVEDMFHHLDLDKDGEVSYTTFLDTLRVAYFENSELQAMRLRLEVHEIKTLVGKVWDKLEGRSASDRQSLRSRQKSSKQASNTAHQERTPVQSRECTGEQTPTSTCQEAEANLGDLAKAKLPSTREALSSSLALADLDLQLEVAFAELERHLQALSLNTSQCTAALLQRRGLLEICRSTAAAGEGSPGKIADMDSGAFQHAKRGIDNLVQGDATLPPSRQEVDGYEFDGLGRKTPTLRHAISKRVEPVPPAE
eukprot:gb/GFBE01021157.1/.p1 GENE.gb/GFBE01021157.1/~~gb/GFBE01021157.1/.p1  ORF type:complete len:616 (+),score=114.71 gb/GFBE01021157.1/:1-1848(+)